MDRFYIIHNDGSFELLEERREDCEIIENCFDPATLGAGSQKVYDALLNNYLYLFDLEWFEDMLKGNLDNMLSMLFNSYCEDSFLFSAGLKLEDLAKWLREENEAGTLSDDDYFYKLGNFADSAIFYYN